MAKDGGAPGIRFESMADDRDNQDSFNLCMVVLDMAYCTRLRMEEVHDSCLAILSIRIPRRCGITGQQSE